MAEPHCPRLVDDPAPPVGAARVDSDLDGHPDTIVLGDGVDLVLGTDLDGDGWVDRMLRIGPDGEAREFECRWAGPGDPGGPDGD